MKFIIQALLTRGEQDSSDSVGNSQWDFQGPRIGIWENKANLISSIFLRSSQWKGHVQSIINLPVNDQCLWSNRLNIARGWHFRTLSLLWLSEQSLFYLSVHLSILPSIHPSSLTIVTYSMAFQTQPFMRRLFWASLLQNVCFCEQEAPNYQILDPSIL